MIIIYYKLSRLSSFQWLSIHRLHLPVFCQRTHRENTRHHQRPHTSTSTTRWSSGDRTQRVVDVSR